MGKRVTRRRKEQTLIEILASAIPGLVRGEFIGFSCETGDGSIRAHWNKDCDRIDIHIIVEPI